MKKYLLFLLLLSIQLSAQCWEKIAVGAHHAIAIKDDGTLWGWGANWHGQLARDPAEIAYVTSPVLISDDTSWKNVDCGVHHVIAVKTDGTLWAVGWNDDRQLGIGQAVEEIYQLTQVGSDNDWNSVFCGWDVSFSIKNNGTLWGWGKNQYGNLGDGTNSTRDTPVQIGTDTDWEIVASGVKHTLAIKTDGTLWAWGKSYDGALGIGGTGISEESSPVQCGTDADWKSIIVGTEFSAGLKDDGTIWVWGKSGYGELGNGDTFSAYYVPTQLGTELWTSISGRYNNVFAIKANGTLWAWGFNENGQLADGTTTNRNIPTFIESFNDPASIMPSYLFTLALKEDGTLWAWGSNMLGHYGNGTILESGEPPGATPVYIDNCATATTIDHLKQQFTFYPNPAAAHLNIVTPENTSIEQITIAGINGNTILTQTHTSQINVQQLPAGMYFIEIKTDSGSSHHKFIKE
ncbi:MAG TPA: T9SS type A sorting domain-containing protein [Flavobacterium sp.]|nr:T9SS type A sorting domain-containing protein [Flavobacterium sp.]